MRATLGDCGKSVIGPGTTAQQMICPLNTTLTRHFHVRPPTSFCSNSQLVTCNTCTKYLGTINLADQENAICPFCYAGGCVWVSISLATVVVDGAAPEGGTPLSR